MLASAGVTPADAQVRKQCTAALMETDDPPEFFDCVYVQTEKDPNLFSLEDGLSHVRAAARCTTWTAWRSSAWASTPRCRSSAAIRN